MTRTDAELLEAASEDPQAFREFYDRYAVWIRSWFLRHTGAETASLDLTAETFAQAWHASRRFRDEANGSGAPWLFGIARNLLRQYHKHNRIESAARARMGLDVSFADCEDYERVDERSEAGALVVRQGADRVQQDGSQGPGRDALVDRVVVVRALPVDRQAEPCPRRRLDPVVLVVLPQQVAGDAEQPRGTRAVREILEAAQHPPRLREGLRRQVQRGGLRPRLALEPGADPDRVALIELAERLRVGPGGEQQLGVGAGGDGHAFPPEWPLTKRHVTNSMQSSQSPLEGRLQTNTMSVV